MVPPNGPAAARSASTWIHWWSPVASANWLTCSWVTVCQGLCPRWLPCTAASAWMSANSCMLRDSFSSCPWCAGHHQTNWLVCVVAYSTASRAAAAGRTPAAAAPGPGPRPEHPKTRGARPRSTRRRRGPDGNARPPAPPAAPRSRSVPDQLLQAALGHLQVLGDVGRGQARLGPPVHELPDLGRGGAHGLVRDVQGTPGLDRQLVELLVHVRLQVDVDGALLPGELGADELPGPRGGLTQGRRPGDPHVGNAELPTVLPLAGVHLVQRHRTVLSAEEGTRSSRSGRACGNTARPDRGGTDPGTKERPGPRRGPVSPGRPARPTAPSARRRCARPPRAPARAG